MKKILMLERCRYEVRAIHSNPSPPLTADIECVEHAHVFEFECARKLNIVPKSWSANNLRGDVEEFLHDYFPDHPKYGMLNFQQHDCIALAELLITKLNLESCRVMEQGIGGIELFRIVDINHFDLAQDHLRKI
jgi:hypothetical protein